MRKFYSGIVNRRKIILILFFAAAVLCFFLKDMVRVNYDMSDYLPEDTASTISLNLMQEEFEGGIPNARVAVFDVTIPEALAFKVEEIRAVIGENNAVNGSAVSTADATSGTVKEIRKTTVIAVAFVLFVLMLTATSWFEPPVVLLGLGIAILLNMGSNLMFGEISFVTNAAGAVLQLAVSLDYSVFLIHRYEECLENNDSPKEAMVDALCKSTTSILSSGLTTVIGFLALVFMQFQIGPDLGLALAKGVGISLLTVFIFMPSLILGYPQAYGENKASSAGSEFQEIR